MNKYFDIILEEINQDQAKNMLGQIIPPEQKVELKPKFGDVSYWLTDVINSCDLQIADEKPTLMWLIKQISNNEIQAIPDDIEEIIQTIKGYAANRGHLQKLQDYTYFSLKEAISEFGVDSIGELVEEGGNFRLYKISTVEDAMKSAEGTNWCIANRQEAEPYIMGYGEYKGGEPLYMVMRGSKKFALLHFVAMDFEDVRSQMLSYRTAAMLSDALPLLKQKAHMLLRAAGGISRFGNLLMNVPINQKVLSIQAVEALFGFINSKNPEDIMDIIKVRGEYITCFDPSQLTPDMVKIAIQNDDSNKVTNF